MYFIKICKVHVQQILPNLQEVKFISQLVPNSRLRNERTLKYKIHNKVKKQKENHILKSFNYILILSSKDPHLSAKRDFKNNQIKILYVIYNICEDRLMEATNQ